MGSGQDNFDSSKRLEELAEEREDTLMIVQYSEKGRSHVAVGFYFGIDYKNIDLRNFQGRIQDALRTPTGYTMLEIPRESFINYKVLELKKE
jgi:hypothetical protein